MPTDDKADCGCSTFVVACRKHKDEELRLIDRLAHTGMILRQQIKDQKREAWLKDTDSEDNNV